ncbi:cytochrome C oxidase subunit II [Cohnella lupini]|uniref:Cytochrome c oxidase subunit 2 n=1 Tax=Cohnella lupini TaxID=1294267 RepID=A0A3D9IPX3_9BACL|nr:cytochrome C oxidase subunit II [Cohnella lupini]RED63840.1 cytochrome c oxidase subunit 2 [Cohnella lupini]
MQRKIAYFLTLTALVLALSACGGNNKDAGSDNSSSAPVESASASTELVITAKSWEFDKPEYTMPKDTPVKITLENTSGAHGVEIVGQDVEIVGNKSEVVTLPAGTYEIECAIMCGSGHSKMKAKLIVS